jgi:spore germination protein GerM
MNRRLGFGAALAAVAIAAGWVLFVGLPRWYGPTPPPPMAAPAPPEAERKITATLYYVTDDGAQLTGVQREVSFGEPAPDQARRIVEAQIAAPPAPLVSAVPDGTTLRSLYITDKGDAFVDLSGELRAKHTGGALDELLTVYTIVNVLTANLPAIQRVQILIDGKEVDTLAGHVDLRHPFQKQLGWVHTDKE